MTAPTAPLRVYGIDLGGTFMPAVRAKRSYAPRDPHTRLRVHAPDTQGDLLTGTIVFLVDGKAHEGRVLDYLGGGTYRVDLDSHEVIHFGVTEVTF